MPDELRSETKPRPDLGPWVTAAQRAFNSPGGGSNPSGPTVNRVGTTRSQVNSTWCSREPPRLKGTAIRSLSTSTRHQALVV